MFILPELRRQSVRRDAHTECQVVAEDGFRLLGERTLDVSDEGLLLQSEALADIGETVFVSLKVPGGVSWSDAAGVIVRYIRGLRDGDRGRGWGIRFEQIDPVDRGILRGALVGRPPPLPCRVVKRDYATTIADIWRQRLLETHPPFGSLATA